MTRGKAWALMLLGCVAFWAVTITLIAKLVSTAGR